ncbi:MAG: preprotein translocase subunit SecA [Bacteroidetes bacterium]|nr:preprotein translocase subunit SecA [Bacteroidota bacterium]
MISFITKLFGTKSGRELKKLQPYVNKINTYFKDFKNISNDDLRNETKKLKEYLKNQLQGIQDKINNTKKEAEKTNDIDKKSELFKKIDELEKDYNIKLEESLNEILPKAFAIVKETARRFKENETLEVTIEDYDRRLATKNSYVKIEKNKAIWSNSWEAAGNTIVWDMLHYDVQLVGGIILHQGKVAEMATGEGKTLVATLPAFLNALSGKGVHVITVNDYLARRDGEWMGPIYEFHGLTMGCIDKTHPHSEERHNAYLADITYGTNNEFGFDYLRDNMVDETSEIVQRKHHYAMVDEVDSVLIDDARTPLIISGPSAKSNEEEYYALKPMIQKIYQEQRHIITKFLQEARKLIKENPKDEKGALSLFRVYRGLPKYRPLIKFLSETGIKQLLQKTENYYIQDNSRMMPEADEPLLFTIEEKNNHIELTDRGIEFLTKEAGGSDFFVMPDMGTEIAKIENKESLSEDEKSKKKEELNINYNQKNERIHITTQLLKAYTLFEKDVDYIIQNDEVKIVDEQTGRVLEGRRYSSGLHQAIEAKENVIVQKTSQTYATVTLQNYFRMYHKLAGMTGTAETEAGELWEIYKLDVVVAPTNKPIVRDDRDDKIFRTAKEKFKAIIEEIVELTTKKRPVLVGTTSVEISELVSRVLTLKKIKHQVLNAKQHQKEAEVIAEAGKPGTVTIATNMAGRGTDIKLAPESKEAGGLAIIGTERHESRRVDRQLRGRAGRQGDPGSSQFFVSLEDDLMRLFGSERIANLMDKMGLEEGEVIQHSMVTKSIERAQRKVEENNFSHRKRLLEYDDVMNIQREVVYSRRRHALFGERLSLDIMNMISETASYVSSLAVDSSFEQFKLAILQNLGVDINITEEDFKLKNEDLEDKLYDYIYNFYENKKKHIRSSIEPVFEEIKELYKDKIENISIPVTDGITEMNANVNLDKCIESKGKELTDLIEKTIILDLIDQFWKEHLQELDDLRQSVQNAVYEQKDPLIIYKFESFNLFQKFINKINLKTVAYLLKAYVPTPDSEYVKESKINKKQSQKLIESKEALYSAIQEENDMYDTVSIEPIKVEKMPGRNDRVTVQYDDGSIKENVKFKTVEADYLDKKCILI